MFRPITSLRGQLALTVSVLAIATIAQPAFAQDQAPEAVQCPDGKTAPVGEVCPPSPAGSTDAQPGTADTTTQNGNAPDDTIVVTGSRIARKELQSISPITVLDSKSIETRGFSTLGQALQELPRSAFRAHRRSALHNRHSVPGRTFSIFSVSARNAR